MSKLKLRFFSLKPLFLVLPQQKTALSAERLQQAYSRIFSRYLPPSGPFLIREVFQLSEHFCGPPLIHSNGHLSFLYWGPQCENSTPHGYTPKWNRGAKSPALTCWLLFSQCSPWMIGFLGCKCTFSRHPSVSQGFSLQAYYQPIHSPVCINTGLGAGSCTWPCWSPWDFTQINFSNMSRSLLHPFP